MNTQMIATVQLDEFYHLRLWHLIFFRSIPQALGRYAIVIAVLLLFLQSQDGWSYNLLWGLAGGTVAMFLILGIHWLFLPSRAGRLFKETAQIDLPKQFSVDEEGFTFVCDTGHQRTSWSELVKWDENSDVIALFVNRIMAYAIPKPQVSPEMQTYIRHRLRDAGLTAAGKARK